MIKFVLPLFLMLAAPAMADNATCTPNQKVPVVCLFADGSVILTAPSVDTAKMVMSVIDSRPRPRPSN